MRKIGAACNAFAENTIEQIADARSAEVQQKGEDQRVEPTWDSLYAGGNEIAKNRRQKVFNFTREQYALRIIYRAILHFPTFFAKVGTIRKIRKIDWLPGSPVRDRAVKFFAFAGLLGLFGTKKNLGAEILNWGRC